MTTTLSAAAGSTALPRRNGSAHFVRLFKPRFAPLVRAGAKTQTVRPTPKRMPKPGDTLSLRWWSGKPYRSKQRVICEATVTRVDRCLIADGALYIDDKMLTVAECNAFARADGFPSANDLWDWFRDTHGLPFTGIVIHWQNGPAQERRAGDSKNGN